MRLRARVHIIILMLFLGLNAFNARAQHPQPDRQPRWEQTDGIPADSKPVDQAPNVRVQDMYIYIELEQPSPVTLFTILGQPVSQMSLPGGISRIKVNARGIYILKIGSSTRRITI